MKLLDTLNGILRIDFTVVDDLDLSVEQAEKLLKRKKVHKIAIENNGEFIAFLTQNDINTWKSGFAPSDHKLRLRSHSIDEIMRTSLAVVYTNSSLEDIYKLTQTLIVDAVFIVDDHKLLGYVASDEVKGLYLNTPIKKNKKNNTHESI